MPSMQSPYAIISSVKNVSIQVLTYKSHRRTIAYRSQFYDVIFPDLAFIMKSSFQQDYFFIGVPTKPITSDSDAIYPLVYPHTYNYSCCVGRTSIRSLNEYINLFWSNRNYYYVDEREINMRPKLKLSGKNTIPFNQYVRLNISSLQR